MARRTLGSHLERLGAEVNILGRAEAAQLFERWCEAYCGKVKLQTGKYRYKGFHWHAFSYELSPCSEGDEARELYQREAAADLIMIPEFWREAEPLRCRGLSSPDLSGLRMDLYVFPPGAEWTMAYTHEHGWLGPYFSRKEWCDSVA